MSINFIVIYLIFAIIVCAFIHIYAWRNPQTRGSRAFMVTCLISILWMLGDVSGRLSNSFEAKWAGESLRYFGIVLLPVALLTFVYQYCGRSISRKGIALLLAIPLISWLMMLTNSWHHLFFKSVEIGVQTPLRTEYGTYFWSVHLPYSYGLLLIAYSRLFVELSRASHHFRKQILVLFTSFCIPFIVNVIGIFKLLGEISYTALSIPIFLSVVAYAMFRHQFLRSNPIAFEMVFQTIRDGVLILDQNDLIRDINPAAAKGLEKNPKEVIGFHVRDAFSAWPSAIELYDKKPHELGEIEVTLFGSTRFLSIDSTPLKNSANAILGRIITIRDITDRHKHQLSLEALAFHDPLTRLANRRKFQEEVELAIKKAAETGESLAILYFDLNRFKNVNDTLGHEAGDELLKYVAARVASILRKPDIIARLGGDEFALLLHNCDEDGIEIVVQRILENVKRPFRIGENTLIPDLSLGVAFYPQHGHNLTELLRHADTAMYRAKQSGGGLSMITQLEM